MSENTITYASRTISTYERFYLDFLLRLTLSFLSDFSANELASKNSTYNLSARSVFELSASRTTLVLIGRVIGKRK